MAKYNLEQLQQQNMQEVKKTRTLAELRDVSTPVEKNGLLETAGQFVKDVAVETTKPVVQSLLSPYQAVATAFNIARAPSKEKVESETAKTTAVIKRMKELEKMGQTKTSEYSNLVSQLKQKSEAYKKSDTFVAPETISTGIWGDIETPKTVEEVLGTGAKTLSLAASPAVGGALWSAGEAMQQNKGLGEVLGYTVAGGALGKVGELAFKGLGSLMKVSGKALAATKVGGTIAGSLSATEKNAERVMASLIKPLKKNLSFGKRPALELAREVAKSDKVPSNWDGLVSFTSKAKQKSGKEIGKFYDKADKTIKTRFNAETALKTIDNAMDEAAAKNNTALMNRLSAIKQAITQTLVKKFDKKTGQWIIKSTGTKDLTKLKPSEVQNLIREIGEQVKWTGNYSDDLTVNRTLIDTYRTLRRGFEAGLSAENKATGALARRLNEKYANLTSALDAVNYRKDVVNRQALVSLTDQQAAMAGGLFNAIRGGGNIGSILAGIGSGGFSKMIKSPWFATNLTKTIMKLSPAKRQSIFLKYPMLRGVVNQTLKTAGKGIEKFGSVLAGTPKVIRKAQTTPVSELSQKASKLMPFGATIKDVGEEGFKKAGVPKSSNIFTKEDAGLAKTIRESKGLSADDIMSKYPDIKLKKDIPAKDIHGNKIEIPQGETLTPYEIKGNKVLLQDGQTYIVAKNQFQNIKGNSIVAEGKKFAPELEGLEETIKGVSKWQGDELIDNGNRLADVYEENGKWHYRSDFVEESPAFKTRKEAMENAEADALGVYSGNDTKYSSYTLPGGENYREILIKAPESKVNEGDLISFKDWKKNNTYGTQEEYNKVIERAKKSMDKMVAEDRTFISSHWDEPNVISHIRMNERTYNGKKVAFMEELQSDWAREARKDAGMAGLPERLKQPSHPLLKNWQTPTIKRALKDAVDNNAEYFAWTTGEQQSARYNLAKQVDNINWEQYDADGSKNIWIKPKEGREIELFIDSDGKLADNMVGQNMPDDWRGKKIDEVLGKGLADKIMEKETGTLSGEGLKFGGEWANNLYDKQVKNIVEDLTGGKVEMIDLGLPIEKKVAEFYDLKKTGYNPIKPSELKVGNEIGRIGGEGSYIITDVLGDGKFKAVPKSEISKQYEILLTPNNADGVYGKYMVREKGRTGRYGTFHETKAEAERHIKDFYEDYTKETFDISQKTTQQQAIKLTPEIKAVIKGEAPKLKKINNKYKYETVTTKGEINLIEKADYDKYTTPKKRDGNLSDANLEKTKQKEESVAKTFFSEKELKDIKHSLLVAERDATLTKEGKRIEELAYRKIAKNPEKIVNESIQKYGKVVNADNLKKEFKDVGYRGVNSADVHEPASWLSKKIWNILLKKNPEQYAVLYAGGSGTGKTSAIKNIPELKEVGKKASAIFDSNLSKFDTAKKRIEESLDAGKEPMVVYVYREPIESFVDGVVKRMKTNKEEMGRIVPVKVIAENHIGSLETIKKLFNKYGDDINFYFVDNSRGKKNAALTTFDKIKNIKYPNNLREILNKEAVKLEKAGEITKEQLQKYLQ